MTARKFAVAALLAAALPFAGCVESEIKVGVKADGTGSFRAANKFSEKAAAAIWRLKTSDPNGEFAKEIEKNMFRAPDEAGAKALAEKGLKVTEAEFKMEEKVLSSKLGVEFKRIEAFQHLASMQGVLAEGQGMGLTLTREKEGGVYVLALRISGGSTGFDAEDAAGDADGGEDGEPGEGAEAGEVTAEDAAKQEAAMALMGELAGEADAFKARFVLEVPGTVVDFKPTAAGKKEDGRVAWELDMGAMVTIGMEVAQEALKEGGEVPTEPGALVFSVRFKPAEGVVIPDDALWSGPAKPAAKPAPTDGKAPGEPAPPAPAPAPAPAPPAPTPPAPTPPKDE